jgi:hypothetical protein
MTPRLVGIAVLSLVVAFGAGWIFGQSGKSALEDERRTLAENVDFMEARALAFSGRISLFLVNFGDASRQFEQARATVERIQTRMREAGEAERAGRVEIAAAHLREAQQLSASLDPRAHKAAEEALAALDNAR